ncbi:MAG: hypothetical protein Q8930_16990, partial [Bacillota bacterium]|nr:hypothetical protein [Bacillota bacterium]
MATRSKNSFLYSITFTLAVLLLGYTVLVTASLGINYEYISKASYFKSHLFLFSLDLYSSDLNQYYTTYKDYPQKTDVQKISEEDIKNAVDANENYVKDGTAQIEEKYRYLTESTDRTKEERDAAVKQRDAELEKYRKDNTKTEELIRKELVEEKDKNYIDLKNSIDARGGIKYYLTFRSTGEVCTNLSITSGIDNYISENNLLYWDRYPKEITSKEEQDYDRINENLLRADLQGYFIVPKNMENYSSIYNENAFFNSTRIRLINEAIAGAAAFFISIVLFFITSRRK